MPNSEFRRSMISGEYIRYIFGRYSILYVFVNLRYYALNKPTIALWLENVILSQEPHTPVISIDCESRSVYILQYWVISICQAWVFPHAQTVFLFQSFSWRCGASGEVWTKQGVSAPGIGLRFPGSLATAGEFIDCFSFFLFVFF